MLRLRGEAVREVCWGEEGWSRWRKRGRAKEEEVVDVEEEEEGVRDVVDSEWWWWEGRWTLLEV